jgi:hypothetical protein
MKLDRPDDLKSAARWDDRILAIVMLGLGLPRVILAFADHETFGAEPTIAAIVAGLGLLLLLTTRRAR